MPLVIVWLRRLLVPGVQPVFGMSGRLGLDYVERNLGRSTMNVLALMVAVALSLGISGWLRSFESAVLSWFEQVSAADLTVTAGSPLADRRRMPLAPDVVEHLRGVPGVLEVQPIRMIDQAFGAETFSLLSSDTRAYLGQAARRNKPWQVVSGKSPIGPSELHDAPRIVLGQNAAHRLGLAAGDRMRLQTPSGTMDFEVRAVVVDYSSELGAGFIDQRYYVKGWGDKAVDVVNVYLAEGVDGRAAAQQVRARLGGGKALFVTQTQGLRDEFLSAAHEGFSYARAIELIVLLIALMGVIGTLVAAVLDRTRELGMLRAVGATRGQIVRALVLEAAFLGICAVVGGIASGSIQCELLLRTVVAQNSGWHLDFVFPGESVLRFSLLVLGASAVAGFLPGLRAAQLDVKTALASE
jgi:putative ABC transport system permease protein